MSMVEAQLVSSKKQDWETPEKLFQRLDSEFGFDLDAASDGKNAKCELFLTEEDDALSVPWRVGDVRTVFCNPPYGRGIGRWVEKAFREAEDNGLTGVLLIFARTDTSWWHDYVMKAATIRFIRGRLTFEVDGEPAASPAPAPSCVVVFKPTYTLEEFRRPTHITTMERPK